jgi:RimJ/RimL family protein N-acetyltransferase
VALHRSRIIITEPKEAIAAWVQEKLGDEHPWEGNYNTMGYFDTRKQKLIAAVVYDRWIYNGNHQWQDVCMHVAGEGLWCTPEFLYAAFDYPFNQAGCRRVTGLVSSENLKARRLDEHIGFTCEAEIKEGSPHGADTLIYRMFNNECKWIQDEKFKGQSWVKNQAPPFQIIKQQHRRKDKLI